MKHTKKPIERTHLAVTIHPKNREQIEPKVKEKGYRSVAQFLVKDSMEHNGLEYYDGRDYQNN